MIPCLQVRTNKRDMIQLSINLNMKMMAMRLKRLPLDWPCFILFFLMGGDHRRSVVFFKEENIWSVELNVHVQAIVVPPMTI